MTLRPRKRKLRPKLTPALLKRVASQLHEFSPERVAQFINSVRMIDGVTRAFAGAGPLTPSQRLKTLRPAAKAAAKFRKALGAIVSGISDEETPVGYQADAFAQMMEAAGTSPAQFLSIINTEERPPPPADPLMDDPKPIPAEDSEEPGAHLHESWCGLIVRVAEFQREVAAKIKQLESVERRGTKHADENATLIAVAATYARTFGKVPSTTPGEPFYNIAVILLGQKNVERPVRAAVARVKAHLTKKPKT